MNIAFVAPSPNETSGVGQYSDRLAATLDERVTVRRVSLPYADDGLTAFLRTAWRAGGTETDVVHVQFDYVLFGPKGLFALLFFPLLAIQARRHDFTVVVTMHEVLTASLLAAPLVGLKRLYVVILNRTLTRTTTTVVVLSQAAKRRYRSSVGADDCVQLPHGVDNTAEYEINSTAAKRRFGYDSDEPVVVEPGFVSPRKGSDLFVELARQCPDLSFLLAGGPPRERLRPFFEQIVSTKPATLQVTDVLDEQAFHAAFQAADVVVLPYNETEQTGVINAVNQSGVFNWCATYGVPVVGADCEHFRAVSEEWGAVEVVDVTDFDAFGATVRDVLDDEEHRERLVAGIEAYAAAQSLESAAQEHVSLYERLVEP